ncbi:MAG: RNA polymerase sigma-70 factor [Bacteroidetes bacterium]|nr:RNA polymerase sigma-70 factor [Bacteroidota bacterium]
MKLSGFNIVKDIQEGNIKTFEEVFINYYPFLQKFAEGYVNNKDEASDIVQSVFLSVWERKEKLKTDTNLNNYLITLTKNQCLNFIKHLKAKQTYLQSQSYNVNELLLNYYALENLNENKLILNELTAVIENAINSLPEQCKEIFRMSRFENMKYQEIADKMDISVKTVEKKMSISLGILRAALKDYLMLFLFLYIR